MDVDWQSLIMFAVGHAVVFLAGYVALLQRQTRVETRLEEQGKRQDRHEAAWAASHAEVMKELRSIRDRLDELRGK